MSALHRIRVARFRCSIFPGAGSPRHPHFDKQCPLLRKDRQGLGLERPTSSDADWISCWTCTEMDLSTSFAKSRQCRRSGYEWDHVRVLFDAVGSCALKQHQIYLYLYIYISIYLYIYISISLYLYISISLYLYLSISISIYIYIYTYTHTYIYTSLVTPALKTEAAKKWALLNR